MPNDDVDLASLESYIGFLLIRAQHKLYAQFTDIMLEVDLLPAQFALLTLLKANPGIMPSRASNALGIQKANFVRLQVQLEERGLIERQARDGRSFGLRLTKDGSATLRKALRLHREFDAAVRDKIGADGERTLRPLLLSLTR